MTAFGPQTEDLMNLQVDWGKNLILFVQSGIDTPATEIHLKSVSGNGKQVTIAAVTRTDPNNPASIEIAVRPSMIASAPAAAFAGNLTVKFSIDGRDMPVAHEK
jgi:hypothetical protein